MEGVAQCKKKWSTATETFKLFLQCLYHRSTVWQNHNIIKIAVWH